MRTTGIIEKKLKFERESRKRRRKVRGMRERRRGDEDGGAEGGEAEMRPG